MRKELKNKLGSQYLKAIQLDRGPVLIPHNPFEYLGIIDDEGVLCTENELRNIFNLDGCLAMCIVSDSDFDRIVLSYGSVVRCVSEYCVDGVENNTGITSHPMFEATYYKDNGTGFDGVTVIGDDVECNILPYSLSKKEILDNGNISKDDALMLAGILDGEVIPLEELQEMREGMALLPLIIDCCHGKFIEALIAYANSPDDETEAAV